MDNALFSLDFQSRRTFGAALCASCGGAQAEPKTGRSGFADTLSGSSVINLLSERAIKPLQKKPWKLRHNMGLPPFSFKPCLKTQCRHSEEAEKCIVRNWRLSSMSKS